MRTHSEIDRLARSIYAELERLRDRMRVYPLVRPTAERRIETAVAALRLAQFAVESGDDLLGPIAALRKEHDDLAKLVRAIAPTRP